MQTDLPTDVYRLNKPSSSYTVCSRPLTVSVSLHWSPASWPMACQTIYIKQEECKPGHRSGSFRAGVPSFVVRRGLPFLQMSQVPPCEVSQVLYSAGCIQTALLHLYGHTWAFTGSKLILSCASAMHIARRGCGWRCSIHVPI